MNNCKIHGKDERSIIISHMVNKLQFRELAPLLYSSLVIWNDCQLCRRRGPFEPAIANFESSPHRRRRRRYSGNTHQHQKGGNHRWKLCSVESQRNVPDAEARTSTALTRGITMIGDHNFPSGENFRAKLLPRRSTHAGEFVSPATSVPYVASAASALSR